MWVQGPTGMYGSAADNHPSLLYDGTSVGVAGTRGEENVIHRPRRVVYFSSDVYVSRYSRY